jgi:hypothetical protein
MAPDFGLISTTVTFQGRNDRITAWIIDEKKS